MRDPEAVVAALREHFEKASVQLTEVWQDAPESAKPARATKPAMRLSRAGH